LSPEQIVYECVSRGITLIAGVDIVMYKPRQAMPDALLSELICNLHEVIKFLCPHKALESRAFAIELERLMAKQDPAEKGNGS
jgi:hypothetical protein